MKVPTLPREIAWLHFNDRVLREADDDSVPLVGRMRFLGIFSANLDEFFRVRVATLKRLAMMRKTLSGHDPRKVLKQIQDLVLEQTARYEEIYAKLLTSLRQAGISILNEQDLDKRQQQHVRAFFYEEVRPRLVPLMLESFKNFPAIKDENVNLAVSLQLEGEARRQRYALIELPPDLPRFIELPAQGRRQCLMFLDDVVRFGLRYIFSIFDVESVEAYAIKLTRDSEIDIEEDFSESYLERIHESLRKRKKGAPVRFVYDATIPKGLLNFFIKGLHLSQMDAFIPGSRYHNFKDLIRFPDLGRKDLNLRYPQPIAHPQLHGAHSLLSVIARSDVLLHFPYHPFSTFIDVLREAAIDPDVREIKLTVYRASAHSHTLNTLINAARNGKRVTVVLEPQARFDEESNINWANKLSEEGVRVILGVRGLKIHAKLCLILRQEDHRTARTAAIGTGNFNEATARTYCDHLLLTCDPQLTREVEGIFEYLEGPFRIPNFKHIIFSPFYTRKRLLRLIAREIDEARAGKEAYIHAKLNNLDDAAIIQRLYQAGQAGVRVRLIVRGMCALIPGAAQLSENIEAIRIVDQYLEHSRLFVFASGGEPRVFISSSDWMVRNFDRRVEVTCPIFDRRLQKELRDTFDLLWNDNVKASPVLGGTRELGNSETCRSQVEIHRYLKQSAAAMIRRRKERRK